MSQNFCCPQCGYKKLQVVTETNTQTTGSNYSGGKGCLGFLLFGPLGLLCGSCGQGQTTTTTNTTYWVCPQCGKKFKHPDELRKKIDSLNKSVFNVMCIIGIVMAVIFLMVFAEVDIGFATILGLFTFGIFALIGYIFDKMNISARSKLEEELYELQRNMNRFKDE